MLNFETLAINLPEDVLKRKWAGDFEGEIALIDALLEKDVPQVLRDRLQLERCMAERFPKQYCFSRPQALAMIREKVADFAEAELDSLELARMVDYIYIRGEKYYLHSFLDTLLKICKPLAARAGIVKPGRDPMLDDAIAEMKRTGELSYRIRLRSTLRVKDDAFVKGGRYRVHMPLPQVCAQQSEIEIKPTDFAYVAAASAPQRTAFFDRMLAENAPFQVEYSYRNTMRYVDPLSGEAHSGEAKRAVYPDAPAVTQDDLAEQRPHISFTPYLKALARELIGNETEPVRIAWRFYAYITTHVHYSYMRSYFLIENQPEYCALNFKGDCGIQALLFITLCRIAGIPARWQSGLGVHEKHAGSHDWAQFYLEDYGWLFCDPSYGGGALRDGSMERWAFYFGNLDPFRMVANARYQTDFDPPKRCDRTDPYDNQDGEVEIDGRGLQSSEFDTETVTLELQKL